MAIAFLRASVVSRGRGSSSVASAAYITGDRMRDERTGRLCNYTRRRERVIDHGVMLPQGAPQAWSTASGLMNAIEAADTAKDSATARKYVLALPRELNLDSQRDLVMAYIRDALNDHGYGAVWAIHTDAEHNNPHAHVLVPNRPITKSGRWGAKNKSAYRLDENGDRIPIIDPVTGQQKLGARNAKQWQREKQPHYLEQRSTLPVLKTQWADHVNQALDRAGRAERIDARSYEDQGLDRLPTIHEGTAAREIEARGGMSERMEINRAVRERNAAVDQARADRRLLEAMTNAERRIDAVYRDTDRRAPAGENSGRLLGDFRAAISDAGRDGDNERSESGAGISALSALRAAINDARRNRADKQLRVRADVSAFSNLRATINDAEGKQVDRQFNEGDRVSKCLTDVSALENLRAAISDARRDQDDSRSAITKSKSARRKREAARNRLSEKRTGEAARNETSWTTSIPTRNGRKTDAAADISAKGKAKRTVGAAAKVGTEASAGRKNESTDIAAAASSETERVEQRGAQASGFWESSGTRESAIGAVASLRHVDATSANYEAQVERGNARFFDDDGLIVWEHERLERPFVTDTNILARMGAAAAGEYPLQVAPVFEHGKLRICVVEADEDLTNGSRSDADVEVRRDIIRDAVSALRGAWRAAKGASSYLIERVKIFAKRLFGKVNDDNPPKLSDVLRIQLDISSERYRVKMREEERKAKLADALQQQKTQKEQNPHRSTGWER